MADKDETSDRWSRVLSLLSFALVIGALYFAKEIFLPIALAVLVSFVLTPLVKRLERLRLGRLASVIVVTALAFVVISAVGWLATIQLVQLSNDLPRYKDNLIAKIRSVRGSAGHNLENAKAAIEDIGEELTEGGDEDARDEDKVRSTARRWLPWLNLEPTSDEETSEEKALAVKVVELPPSPLSQIQNWLGPLVAPLSITGMVVVLVIFMLVKREDLRNRIIQLFGTSRLYVTTEAIDDATRRLSRYLQVQLLINVAYGLVVAAGLGAIGVPNALLWGVLGTLLRFLPYVGPWIAAAMPILLSLAVSDGWTQPVMTVGLFVVLELVVNNVLEPWLYGSSAGVSSFGVILSAIFWTWLWGPVGLVLAMPLTVCLVVMGKYVPQLAFLTTLLGDRSTMQPHERLYQRLLAADDLETTRLVEERLTSSSLMEFYDGVLIPALHLAEQDRHAGVLSGRQESLVMESARELVEDLGDRLSNTGDDTDRRTCGVFCIPVRDRADETAAMMLGQFLSSKGFSVQTGSLDLLAGETVRKIEEQGFEIAVLVVLPPLGSRNGRYYCKRLKRLESPPRIVVVLLDGRDLKNTHERLRDAGADEVVTSLPEAVAAVRRAASLVTAERRGQVEGLSNVEDPDRVVD